MMKKIEYKDVDVVYRDLGQGPGVVLVHGYLETGAIWDRFAAGLAERFRVVVPDLPGHGESGTWGRIHTMDDLAGSVKAIMDREGMEQVFLAGHSMGGYVTMAFADLYPERLKGYALVHSTCFADSEEKKKNRKREISLVLCGKKKQIINVNIPKGFADLSIEQMGEEVERARKIALENPEGGIVALLNGMKERPDRTPVLQNPRIPLLLIGGMRDNYIPVEVFDRLVELAPHARVLKLETSGHMGFIEEADAVAGAITSMIMTGK